MEEDFSKYNGEGTTLRKAQLRMLDILIEVDKICRKHNITYWLDGGTCLGAVRHGGFIPWDDDVDIDILQTDYKRFRAAMLKELPNRFFFSDWTTDKYHFDDYPRIKDKKSLFDYPLFYKQKVCGLFVDVFVWDYVPSSRARKIFNFFYRRVWRTLHYFDEAAHTPAFHKLVNKAIALLSFPFIYCAKKIYHSTAKLRTNKLLSYNYITNNYIFPENAIFPLSEIEFEGHKFFAPANTDAFLKIIYGDYMQLPPEDKRLGWHGVKIEVYE